MQRLILKLALFAAMLALPWGVVEWQLERIPNSYSWKRQLLERKGDVAKVLVLGSSHEYLGISPSAFDCEGLNLANTSQALFYDGEIVRRHLPQLGSLRLVLQGISYFSLEFMLSDSAEKWRGFYYRHFLGTRTDPGMSLLDLENFSLVAMYGRDQVLEFAAKRFDVSLTEHVDEYGWYDSRGNETLQPPKEDSGKAAATYHTSTMKPEHLPENVEVIARMRERLRQRGVTLVLITLPVFRTYTAQLDPVRRERWYAEIAQLQARFGLTYRDYAEDSRFAVDDFFDADHLNARGAVKFSRILNEEIIRPLGACAAPLGEHRVAHAADHARPSRPQR